MYSRGRNKVSGQKILDCWLFKTLKKKGRSVVLELKCWGQLFRECSSSFIFRDLLSIEFCQPVFECNSRCSCSKSCQNRVVQNGQHLQLQVFKTKLKGWGLRTLENIKKFTFVCEYAGELISIKEAKMRAQELTHETGNYLIVLREHSSNVNQILRTHVDAHFHGGASRFINHSCNPNLVMVPVRVDSIVPQLALFAARNIDIGEELSFDYSGEFDHWHSHEIKVEHHELKSLQEQGKEPKRCQCGALNCRGYLPFDSSLYSSESHLPIRPGNS